MPEPFGAYFIREVQQLGQGSALVRKNVLFIVLAAIVAVSVLGYIGNNGSNSQPVSGYAETKWLMLKVPVYTPVIDPGHGGEDGGAISATGVNESEINLEICLKMGAFMRFLGIAPIMTRETDVSIHDSSARSIAEKKVSDLKNRAKLVNGIQNAVLLSVHQNEFEESYVKGAEAYYNSNTKSKELAEHTQSVLVSAVDSENKRKAKKIGANYLMNNVTGPAMLVECGFISNPGEEAKLLSESYQLKLAAAVAVSYLNWAGQNTTE